MNRTISIAPMLDFTNTHFRSFARILTQKAILYTQMIHMNAVLHNSRKLLPFEPVQHPVALQLGGSCPETLFKAASIASQYHYDTINLNVGCPSLRVQDGCFGAVLMNRPQLVRKCIEAIWEGGRIPVSIKCRLGVDDNDDFEFLRHFVEVVSGNGQGHCNHFIVHARKAFLKGLSPAENRTVPPLIYERVGKLKQEFPSLKIEINGGINTIQEGVSLCGRYDLEGGMLGRVAINNPFELTKIDSILQGSPTKIDTTQDPTLIRQKILLDYAHYIERLEQNQVTDESHRLIPPATKYVLFKPILNLYKGQLYGSKFRNRLSDMTALNQRTAAKVIRSLAGWMTRQTLARRETHPELLLERC